MLSTHSVTNQLTRPLTCSFGHLRLISTIILLALVLSACGGGSSNSAKTNNVGGTDTTTTDSTKLSILKNLSAVLVSDIQLSWNAATDAAQYYICLSDYN